MPTREARLKLEANRRRREAEAQQSEDRPEAPVEPVALACEEEPVAPEHMHLTHWSRFVLPDVKFFTYYGTNYDRGQLMALVGGPRDEQLTRMGFIEVALTANAHLRAQCGVCGCWFLTEQFRDMHGKLRHSDRFADADLDIGGGMQGPDGGAALRDVTGDAEERRMQQQYPLYLDRSRATLESSGA